MARPIQSTSLQSNNILLKVTVPKWTGRKRKRGSDEPYTDAAPGDAARPPDRRSSKDLLRSLRDNASSYIIQPVGKVDRTHVFRSLWYTPRAFTRELIVCRHAGLCVFDRYQCVLEQISGPHSAT